VFWALDRLSREGLLQTLQHLNLLENYDVGFRSFTEQYFDSCRIFREAVISIMATLAKQERVRCSERTKAGLAIARSRGKRLGRPQLRAEIARLKAQGLSLRAIARQLALAMALSAAC
jgi:DNA invertase Pin-like site-specific DNA recombinase